MLMTREKPLENSSICDCGNESEYLIGTHTFKINEKSITVTNLPHYHCDYCGNASVMVGLKIGEVLKEAYRNNQSQIRYEKK